MISRIAIPGTENFPFSAGRCRAKLLRRFTSLPSAVLNVSSFSFDAVSRDDSLWFELGIQVVDCLEDRLGGLIMILYGYLSDS